MAACSATIPKKAESLLLPLFGGKPQVLEDPGRILQDHIEHWALYSQGRKKTEALISFLTAVKPRKALIFIDRGDRIGKITALLQSHKIPALCLYGGMDKKARRHAVDDFRKGSATILVTSDLSARGLDIPDISHIVALDVGETGDAYIHRAGRTARAGRRGIMTTIGDEIELTRLAALEKKLGIVIYPKALYQGRLERADI
jgi:superfamily II DNA/RNA helicase